MAPELVKHPDPRLRIAAAPVKAFGAQLRERARQLLDVMYASKGVGIAAPQLGWSERVICINQTGDRSEKAHEFVLVNPHSLILSGPDTIEDEGCLSIPGVTCRLRRAQRARLKAQDVTGARFEIDAEGMCARIIQHELEHLVGVLMIDHEEVLRD